MSLDAAVVGRRARPWEGVVDARWLMSYAAGVGRREPEYFDTARPGGVWAHPVFPIAPEWALITTPGAGLDAGLAIEEAMRGVHASHDLHRHRPIPQDTPVTVHAEIVGAQRTRAGARVTVRFDGVSADGSALWTSWMGTVYRGVEVEGEDRPAPVPSPPSHASAARVAVEPSQRIEVDRAVPHVYSECSRIWNPIHTDPSIAALTGLPTNILHGSASFAHGVNAALAALGASPASVTRIGASFRAMVPVPSAIDIAVTADEPGPAGELVARFEIRNAAGKVAVKDGFVVATVPVVDC